MSVVLLQAGRAIPLPFLLDERMIVVASDVELRSEAVNLIREIELLVKPSKWQFKKGLRLIEIGNLLGDATLISVGDAFLTLLYK